MAKTHIHKPVLGLLIALLLVLGVLQPAAADKPGEVEIRGVCIAFAEDGLSFQVQTAQGEIYTVIPPEKYDLTRLQVGSVVIVNGTLDESSSLVARKIRLQNQDEGSDPGEDADDPADGYYCTQSEVLHPFGARLAQRYAIDYAVLQSWYCAGNGWGQIMLALQTGQLVGAEPGTFLEARHAGKGWGLIWKELNLIGRPEDGGPPNDLDGDGRPDHAKPKKEKNTPGLPELPYQLDTLP